MSATYKQKWDSKPLNNTTKSEPVSTICHEKKKKKKIEMSMLTEIEVTTRQCEAAVADGGASSADEDFGASAHQHPHSHSGHWLRHPDPNPTPNSLFLAPPLGIAIANFVLPALRICNGKLRLKSMPRNWRAVPTYDCCHTTSSSKMLQGSGSSFTTTSRLIDQKIKIILHTHPCLQHSLIYFPKIWRRKL